MPCSLPEQAQSFPLESGPRLKTSWGGRVQVAPPSTPSGSPISAIPSFSRRGSRGFDLGFEHTLEESRLHLSGAVFHNSFRDLVDFSPQLFQLVNRSGGHHAGEWNSEPPCH